MISITGGSASSPAEYSFTVTDEIRKSTDRGATKDSEDTIDSHTANGLVAGGTDSYRFAGEISSFDIGGNATVYLNDQIVDPNSLGTEGSSTDAVDPTSLTNVLTIDGSTSSTANSYRFGVSGDVMKSTDRGATVDTDDVVSEGSVEGFVAGGVDSYRFSGDVVDFALDGDAVVYLNGEEVDPVTLDAVLPNRIVIDGTGVDGTSTYSFDVDGEVEKSPRLGSVNDDDTVTDGTVEGYVSGGKDGYRFAGNVTRFHLEGDATVSFEDVDN